MRLCSLCGDQEVVIPRSGVMVEASLLFDAHFLNLQSS